jgi:hypothetical protein
VKPSLEEATRRHQEYYATTTSEADRPQRQHAAQENIEARPIRLDDDVWAECQSRGKKHGTINEGIAAAFEAARTLEEQEREYAATGDPWKAVSIPQSAAKYAEKPLPRKSSQTWKRGPRPKEDKSR